MTSLLLGFGLSQAAFRWRGRTHPPGSLAVQRWSRPIWGRHARPSHRQVPTQDATLRAAGCCGPKLIVKLRSAAFGHACLVSVAGAAGETSGAITGSTGVPARDILALVWRRATQVRVRSRFPENILHF